MRNFAAAMASLFKLLFKALPDKQYLQFYWRHKFHYRLDLDHPVTFNEKLQWLKLYNRHSEYTSLVDKASSKEFADSRLGEGHTVPTLALVDSWDQIEWDSLPERFVIKATNGGGSKGIAICKDKSLFDRRKARRNIERGMRRNIYKELREWPYKGVKPRILIEDYLSDDNDSNCLTDYKFSCFGGKVHDVMVCLDRFSDKKFYFFDRDWNLLRINKAGLEAPEDFRVPRPEGLDELFDAAEKLCQGFPFVRVDLYYARGQVWFSEMTFFPCSGFDRNYLPQTNRLYGELLTLPEKHA